SHSMGGIVTRAFIVRYQSQVVSKIRFLAFFATPTTGSPYAALVAMGSKNPQFAQMYPLNSADSYLEPLQSDWQNGHFGLRSYCAYETQPLLLGKKIVEEDSATHLCTEQIQPIDGDHISIVKPADPTAKCYVFFKAAFEDTERPISKPG